MDAIELTLQDLRDKIYPRAVTGKLATWRWTCVVITQLVYYGTPWLSWHGRQAVLFDLAARKVYLFGLIFWPHDIFYLGILLVIGAYSLFLFTAVAGRLWCGYACPQTVYTEIFMWIEQKIEGNRTARMKLDREPASPRKLGLKAAKHAVWIALALWTGFTFVGYFVPIKTLAVNLAGFDLGPWQTFWILFYGFATYANAGWMREQVCKYMCPYARLQRFIFDADTLIIAYDRYRGEPRGARTKRTDRSEMGLGDCVDCGICVHVCPTGIDIRNGVQYECIGCGACIDGCNQVMDHMGYPRELIRYSTQSVLKHYPRKRLAEHIVRPRVLIYTAILLIISAGAMLSLYRRAPIEIDTIHDRVTASSDGDRPVIENVYRLRIMNLEDSPKAITIRVTGLTEMQLLSEPQPIHVPGGSSRLVPVRVRVEAKYAQKRWSPIDFTLEATAVDDAGPAQPHVVHEKAAFAAY
jgi:cytochrome c oxidase accessory protein FixG